MNVELNDEQLNAVTSTEGFVRIFAGAGSGKTRALTHRFAFLVNEVGILPENILCVTFTNKAANEMRQRIRNLIGDNDTGYINTFHGFCVSVLQEDIYAINYPKSFLILDNNDIDAMLRIIYEERNLTLSDCTFSKAREMIEIQKNRYKPDYYLDMLSMSLEDLYEKYIQATDTDDIIFYGYLYQEKKCFGLDYNDLIIFTLYIFEKNTDIRLKWQKRLEYIMIDEFQDIDELQYKLMKVLCEYHRNLFIVGDPDQTIYTWRGANVQYLMEFDKNFRPSKTIMMLKNYRSTPQILSVANSLISKNRYRIEKDLIPVLEKGSKVVFHFAKNTDAEAEWIVSHIQEMRASGIPFRDITVLYRAHFVTRWIEEALLNKKIPYTIYSGIPFFERVEIKDAISYLRMTILQDDLSFRRIVNQPKRNIGKKRIAFLEEYAKRHDCTLYNALKYTINDAVFKGTKARQFIELIEKYFEEYEKWQISDLLSALLNESGYETMLRTEGSQERLDNLAELKQFTHQYEITIGEETTALHFLSHLALFSNNDRADTSDKVKLMTIHAAKGLEFPYVMLCGMNEGIFPSRKTKDLKGMEEERRLAFVAITRAEKGLFLSGAEGWNYDGSPRYPSRFILNIDEELLDYDGKPNDTLIKSARDYIAHTEKYLPENMEKDLFQIGDRIYHNHLGEGIIQKIDREKGAYVIQFENTDTPRKISFRVKLTQI